MGRFAQADSIQGSDRYAYANNNPILYNDPTGHYVCEGTDACTAGDSGDGSNSRTEILKRHLSDRFSWTVRGIWTVGQLQVIYQAGVDISATLGGDYYLRRLLGSVNFQWKDMRYGGEGDAHNVWLSSYGLSAWNKWTVVHELGHSWDGDYGWRLSQGLENFTGGYTVGDVAGSNCANSANPGCNAAGYFYGGVPPKGSDWLFNRKEDFAESFAALVYPDQARQDIVGNPAFRANQALHYDNYLATTRGMYMDALVYLFTR